MASWVFDFQQDDQQELQCPGPQAIPNHDMLAEAPRPLRCSTDHSGWKMPAAECRTWRRFRRGNCQQPGCNGQRWFFVEDVHGSWWIYVWWLWCLPKHIWREEGMRWQTNEPTKKTRQKGNDERKIRKTIEKNMKEHRYFGTVITYPQFPIYHHSITIPIPSPFPTLRSTVSCNRNLEALRG